MNGMYRVRSFVSAILMSVLLAGVSHAEDTEFTQQLELDVWGYIGDNPEHALMAGAFKRLEIDAILQDYVTGAVIVAPLDSAVNRVDPEIADRVRSDAVAATTLAAHHIPRVRVKPEDMLGVLNKVVVPTYSDEEMVFRREGDSITVNGIPVVEAVEVSNGWIYRIDNVMLPRSLVSREKVTPKTIMETALADPELSRFCEGIRKAGLEKALTEPDRNLTVFAPTNAALEKVPAELGVAIRDNPAYFRRVALNHILGTKQMTGTLRRQQSVTSLSFDLIPVRAGSYSHVQVGLANVTDANIEATNGVIHKVDNLLIPPAVVNALARAGTKEDSSPSSE